MKDKLIFPLAGILCATLLILPAVLLGYNLGKEAGMPVAQPQPAETEMVEDRAGDASDPAAQDPALTAPMDGTITIPGFERVQLSAIPAPQTAPFYNPKGNQCYFVISLFLPGGEEIYRSALIAPGESTETVALSYIPRAGIYENAVLRYSCYSLEDYEVMNGADVDIVLEII